MEDSLKAETPKYEVRPWHNEFYVKDTINDISIGRTNGYGTKEWAEMVADALINYPELSALREERNTLKNNYNQLKVYFNQNSDESIDLRDKIRALVEERDALKAAVQEANWLIDHIMGKEKRIDWGKSFNIDWDHLNKALITIQKTKTI